METNTILQGNCIDIMNSLPEESIDLIFADPPYNLQLGKLLHRPNENKYDGVENDWDKFQSPKSYDSFTHNWLQAAKRILKKNGTIWIIGTYHNIFRVGKILQDLDYWVLNDIIWVKTNPTPNFRGTRFNNAHETLIWAKKTKKGKYTFNYQMMKKVNQDLQMRSDWEIPICQGEERIKIDGKKAHPTQKPEALLSRVILSSSNINDLILDPFFGSGTTGAVAKKLKRRWIGIEVDPSYVQVAKQRIENIEEPKTVDDKLFESFSRKNLPRVAFVALIESGLLRTGQLLFSRDKANEATIKVDGTLFANGQVGSIHQVAAIFQNKARANGWDYWFYQDGDKLTALEELRNQYRRKFLGIKIDEVLDDKIALNRSNTISKKNFDISHYFA